MIIDADDLGVEHTYKLLIATIVPRPIGWISTLASVVSTPRRSPCCRVYACQQRIHDAAGPGDDSRLVQQAHGAARRKARGLFGRGPEELVGIRERDG
jgi:hypothetical protein